MTALEETLIRTLLNPRQMHASRSFASAVAESKTVCVAPSPQQDLGLARQFISAFQSLYPGKRVVLLRKAPQTAATDESIQEVAIGPVDQRLWTLWRSPQIHTLGKMRIDLFIDLDPHFNPLYAFLCRRLNPPLRLTFAKPKSEDYYNLEYTGRPQAFYAERLEGLVHFLAQFQS